MFVWRSRGLSKGFMSPGLSPLSCVLPHLEPASAPTYNCTKSSDTAVLRRPLETVGVYWSLWGWRGLL